ncbi:MAG: 3-oxoacyl-ACP reductase FabG [Defluviitaleaceae bacterium]|nr:3-oxoacyl-ACP reductase FabG [Defluviitaleaceae bacterium]
MKTGKTVLVTGSSRGIGYQIAALFAEAGYNVVLNCINNTSLMNEAVRKFKDVNPNVIGIQCDVSDYKQCMSMFLQIEQVFGSVDILINNAGISSFGLFGMTNENEWRKMVEANLYSVMNCSHIAIEKMVTNKSGRILNISSIWGNVGASCEVAYSTAKAAVNGFTKALAKELAPSGIQVNAIACGAVETDMNNRLTHEEKKELEQSIPIGRFCKPEEIAKLAFSTCTESTTYLTGQIITVDGGLT